MHIEECQEVLEVDEKKAETKKNKEKEDQADDVSENMKVNLH